MSEFEKLMNGANASKVVIKIKTELNEGYEGARLIYNMLKDVPEQLQPCVVGWITNQFVNFFIGSMSLKTIMKAENTSYLDSILTMSTLIEDPDLIPIYKRIYNITEEL